MNNFYDQYHEQWADELYNQAKFNNKSKSHQLPNGFSKYDLMLLNANTTEHVKYALSKGCSATSWAAQWTLCSAITGQKTQHEIALLLLEKGGGALLKDMSTNNPNDFHTYLSRVASSKNEKIKKATACANIDYSSVLMQSKTNTGKDQSALEFVSTLFGGLPLLHALVAFNRDKWADKETVLHKLAQNTLKKINKSVQKNLVSFNNGTPLKPDAYRYLRKRTELLQKIIDSSDDPTLFIKKLTFDSMVKKVVKVSGSKLDFLYTNESTPTNKRPPADKDLINKVNKTKADIDLMISRGISLASKDRYGKHTLMNAIEQGNQLVCTTILAHTPLKVFETKSIMLIHAVGTGQTKICKLLLDHGASVNEKNIMGNTALHIACYQHLSEVISLLLDHQASPNITNNEGYTPSHFLFQQVLFNAAPSLYFDLAALLIDKQADFTISTKNGETVFDAIKGFPDNKKQILEQSIRHYIANKVAQTIYDQIDVEKSDHSQKKKM